MRDALARHRRHRRAAARADRPGRVGLPLPQQARVLVHARRRRAPALGFHRAGRWDEVLDIERCWLTTDLGNAIRDAVRDWARAERLARLRPGDAARATSATSSCARAATPARRSSQLVTAPGERFERRRASSRRCARSPRCARSTGRSTTRPAEVTNLPTTLLWGEEAIEEELLGLRFRVRPNAFLQTNTRDGRAALRARERVRGARPATETVYDLYCGIGTIGLDAGVARR